MVAESWVEEVIQPTSPTLPFANAVSAFWFALH